VKSQHGVALLLVLWVLALLSSLLAGLAGWVHLQNRQALWQRQHTEGILAAEAGLSLAVVALTERNPAARWRADGRPHSLRFNGTALSVSVRSERGKLDLNVAMASDVARVLKANGATPAQADELSHALDQRRGAGQAPLRMLEELRELPGMSQGLYRQVLPYLTLWSGEARPAPALVSASLGRALGLPRSNSLGSESGPIVTVRTRAILPGGYTTTLRVTLLLNPSKEGARPYRVLRWQE